jgi:hypothetical protein
MHTGELVYILRRHFLNNSIDYDEIRYLEDPHQQYHLMMVHENRNMS